MKYTWKHVRQTISFAAELGYRTEFRIDAMVNHDHKLISISKLHRDMESTVYTMLHELGHVVDLDNPETDIFKLERTAWNFGAIIHRQLFGTAASARYYRQARLWLAYYE